MRNYISWTSHQITDLSFSLMALSINQLTSSSHSYKNHSSIELKAEKRREWGFNSTAVVGAWKS
jgi:hypothetical protein